MNRLHGIAAVSCLAGICHAADPVVQTCFAVSDGPTGDLLKADDRPFQPGTTATVAVAIDPSLTYQTIEGFGGALAFYEGWLVNHPFRQEIYTNAFAGLNLSMLRIADWFRYQKPFVPEAAEIVSNANRILGHPVPILMTSWAPPAFLKSNGEVGHGGSLVYTNGAFAYEKFADYWVDSLSAYRALGVSPTWISIQNEPDWGPDYDSCFFRPKEDAEGGTNFASYAVALDTVRRRLAALPSPPKILGPEPVGIGYNVVEHYAETMNPDDIDGLNYHLYHGSTDGTPDGYIPELRAIWNIFPGKPKFMTEFGPTNMIEAANLMHNTLTEGQVSGYNCWSLVWPGDIGLIQIEFPWDRATWTNALPGTATQSHGYWLNPSYWALKHFSYFVTPGFKRVAARSPDTNVLASAYVAPDRQRLVAVLINRSGTASAKLALDCTGWASDWARAYQTAGTRRFERLEPPAGAHLELPASSLTTVVWDRPREGMGGRGASRMGEL
jgi:glucuronoarabinoxylan endo-1,4-beta-xylanase